MSEHDGREPGGEDDVYDALFVDPEGDGGGADDQSRPTRELSPVDATGEEGAETAALQAALEEARREAADFRDRYVRKAADLENARKRHLREREEVVRFGAEGVLREVVSVLDDLERALAHAREGGEDGALAEGVDMVVRKFQQVLERVNCRGFESVGERFDPNRHEALQQVEDASVPHNTVLKEFQRGYLLHDRLLRPAMVVVAQGGPAASASGERQDAGTDSDDARGPVEEGDELATGENESED